MEGNIGSVGKWSVGFQPGKIVLSGELSEKAVLDFLVAKYGDTAILGEVLKLADAAIPAEAPAAV